MGRGRAEYDEGIYDYGKFTEISAASYDTSMHENRHIFLRGWRRQLRMPNERHNSLTRPVESCILRAIPRGFDKHQSKMGLALIMKSVAVTNERTA